MGDSVEEERVRPTGEDINQPNNILIELLKYLTCGKYRNDNFSLKEWSADFLGMFLLNQEKKLIKQLKLKLPYSIEHILSKNLLTKDVKHNEKYKVMMCLQ